jgi:senataxin
MMEGPMDDSETKKKNGLIDLVFSWSLEQIFDENLYRDQVTPIPLSFQTVSQYFSSYVVPLIEETRAELASSMEIIDRSPYAEIVYIYETKSHGEKLFDIKVNYWRNRFSDRGKEPYKTLPGDVIILADSKPEDVSDLQRDRKTWAFAMVTHITDEEIGEGSTSTHFKVKVTKEFRNRDGLESTQFVVFLMNITTGKRIWNSIHMRGSMGIVNEIICPDYSVEDSCDQCSFDCDDEQAVEGPFVGLNESQTKAVLASLYKKKCNHKSSVQLIQGPPGTGKTKTVSVLIHLLLKKKLRTLCCAPTNVAVVELASRVIKLTREAAMNEPNSDDMILSFGDILLFGNKDRLKVGSEVEDIYLEYRVQRLIECLAPLTGWRTCLTSMTSLLEDCVSQYNIFVENEMKAKETEGGGSLVMNLEFDSFLEFLRARFKSIASSVRKCLFTFCTHLARSYLKEVNYQNMVNLIGLLDSLDEMLFKEELISEELEKAFSDTEAVGSYPESLLYLRSKSLSVLKTLRRSLESIHLPNVMNKQSIVDFCFQRASLILCTVSTSYKLKWVEMLPLDLLIIDEAAQLKESESTIPLQLVNIKHAVLIGDECQLPAMVSSNVSQCCLFLTIFLVYI